MEACVEGGCVEGSCVEEAACELLRDPNYPLAACQRIQIALYVARLADEAALTPVTTMLPQDVGFYETLLFNTARVLARSLDGPLVFGLGPSRAYFGQVVVRMMAQAGLLSGDRFPRVMREIKEAYRVLRRGGSLRDQLESVNWDQLASLLEVAGDPAYLDFRNLLKDLGSERKELCLYCREPRIFCQDRCQQLLEQDLTEVMCPISREPICSLTINEAGFIYDRESWKRWCQGSVNGVVSDPLSRKPVRVNFQDHLNPETRKTLLRTLNEKSTQLRNIYLHRQRELEKELEPYTTNLEPMTPGPLCEIPVVTQAY